SNATTTVAGPLTPRPRRPLSSSAPDHHTGTAAAKFHGDRDILGSRPPASDWKSVSFYSRRAWTDACQSLSRADQAAPLRAEDLELLATSAYMLGREDAWMGLLERAHHAYLDAGEALSAVRCAFWVATNLARRGEMGPATGWLGRAQRLLDQDERDCAERGYLYLPVMFRHEASEHCA
ncbi:MAG: hypothetical protein ACRDGT_14005, partial [Candidatus Limnocylindria bacterium]